jgi:hypothetical protein
MQRVEILVLGWMPAVAVVAGEILLRRRNRRLGVETPVSPETVRWVLYAAGVWTLMDAAAALYWIDAQGLTRALVWSVLLTVVATGLLLWYVGARYAPRVPRLRDLRNTTYDTRLVVLRRCRALRRLSYAGRVSRVDLRAGEQLLAQCDSQLTRLQDALATQSFFARMHADAAALAALTEIGVEHRRIQWQAQAFLQATASESVTALELALVAAG